MAYIEYILKLLKLGPDALRLIARLWKAIIDALNPPPTKSTGFREKPASNPLQATLQEANDHYYCNVERSEHYFRLALIMSPQNSRKLPIRH